jgi:four helix bundle protein
MPRNIKNYEVFQLAHQMVLKIYSTTKKFPSEERYGLTSQLRRAAYSIPMNLIEGGAKLGEGEFRRFVDISIGSCAEVEYQIELCHDLKYLSDQDFSELAENYQRIGKMLNRLMQTLLTKK